MFIFDFGTLLIYDRIPQDPEVRSLVIGVTIAGYYAISAWSQVLVWPAVQAPYCSSRLLIIFPHPATVVFQDSR